MGKILVGQKSPKTYATEDISVTEPTVEKPVTENADTESLEVSEREARRNEISMLPQEEQLAALIEDGFEDEARGLSERLASEQREQTDKGTGEENVGTEVPADGTITELNDDGAGKVPESAESTADDAPAEEPGKPKKAKKTATTKKTASKK